MVGCGGVHSFGLFLVGSGNSQDPFFHVRSGCLWPCRGSGLEIVWSHKVAFLIACALGAVVNFAGYMVIKYAGALTLKVRSKQNQKTRHTHIGTRKERHKHRHRRKHTHTHKRTHTDTHTHRHKHTDTQAHKHAPEEGWSGGERQSAPSSPAPQPWMLWFGHNKRKTGQFWG